MGKDKEKNKIKGNIWVKFVVLLLAVTLGSAAIFCGLAAVLFGTDTDLQGTEAQIEEKLDEKLLETYGAVLLDRLSNIKKTEDGLDALDGGNIRYTLVRSTWMDGECVEEFVYTNDASVTENNCMVSLMSDSYYGANAASFLDALTGVNCFWNDSYYDSYRGGYWLGRSFFAGEGPFYGYKIYLSVGKLWNQNQRSSYAGESFLQGGWEDYTHDAARLAEQICRFRRTCGWWLLAAGILFLICFVFLMNAAGCRRGEEQVRLRWIDRVPLEIDLAATGFLVIACLGIIVVAFDDGIGYGSLSVSLVLGGSALFLSAAVAMVLLLCMSLAVRAKAQKFWRYTLAYYLLMPVRHFWEMARANISLCVKGLLLLTAVELLKFLVLLICDGEWEPILLCLVLYKLVEIPVVVHVLMQMNLLKKGGVRIAAGNYSEPIDTSHMLWEFKRHGENINSVGNGISKAVEERMKSEHFRTELITNVSHDIKTPLTSIINYVDLMKKREITDTTMQEYMAVLERQSARLKKLIEDLMEASKASTGNLPVNFEECDAGVLLSQVVGEFEERAKENELELIVTSPGESVHILADGRHLWRIFDNLMSNVCKYAMPGTRVYIDLERFHGMVIVTFRNISRSQLNISSAELMERFVRGDSSRNTEGSGLGLSIAQSLAVLMNGNMAIQIDGDLFKAIVSFEEKTN